jgi:transcriptional regulator with XRE-family HTH domain
MPQTRTYSADAARFGAIVRRLRQQRGWTLRKLATRSGLSAIYVSIVERGGNVPSLTTVLELIEVLGADIGEVMRELAAARNRPAG